MSNTIAKLRTFYLNAFESHPTFHISLRISLKTYSVTFCSAKQFLFTTQNMSKKASKGQTAGEMGAPHFVQVTGQTPLSPMYNVYY